jgi:hypothetical protein
MIRKHYHVIIISLIALFILSSCNPSQQPPTAVPIATTVESQVTKQPNVTLPSPVTPTVTLIPPTETTTSIPATETPTQTPTSSPTVTASPTATQPQPTPSGDQAIFIYLIQTDTGGSVACGDSLVPINTGVPRTGDIAADITTALSRLLVKRKFIAGYYNPVWLSNILIESVRFKPTSGIAQIRLTGTYVRSGDRCDDSRVRAQIWTTIRQFKDVKTVDILLNENLLGDILATGK